VERNRVKRRLREAMMRVVLEDDMAYLVIAEDGDPGLGAVEFDRIVEWLDAAVASGRDRSEERESD
jgi:ribonuclease P protein component